MLKRLYSIFLTGFLFCTILFSGSTALAYTGKTQAQAVNWLNSQVGPGFKKGDGQCVALAKAYYQYLGVSPVSGDGCDYAINALPSGWRRIPGHNDIRMGDIAYYTYGSYYNGKERGHVFIITGVNDQGYNMGLHQNYSNMKYPTLQYTANSKISGVIRPDWPSEDNVKPVISNVKVSNVTAKGYDISCTVTDNVGVTTVKFPTWTSYNGQDDLPKVWPDGTRNGNTWTYHVNVADHNNESGNYITHIYAYDAAGNTAVADGGVTPVPAPDNIKPEILFTKVENITKDGYRVVAVASDNIGVTKMEFPTWTTYNGQDDLQHPWPIGTKVSSYPGLEAYAGKAIYYYDVKKSDHNNETGDYITHVYAFDAAGNNVSKAIETLNFTKYVEDQEKNEQNGSGGTTIKPEEGTTSNIPKMTVFRVSEKNETSFTVQCRVTSPVGINKVTFGIETGSYAKEYKATRSDDTFTAVIPLSDFNYTSGTYEIYALILDETGEPFETESPLKVTINAKKPQEDNTPNTPDSEPGITPTPTPGDTDTDSPSGSTKSVPVYRLYSDLNAEHLYTTDENEVKVLMNGGWNYEGVGWQAPASGKPVYRLYNIGLQNHLYTTDEEEMKELTTKHGWTVDNDRKPLFYSGGNVPIYRVYNKELRGLHHLTTDTFEYNILPSYGWEQEGPSLYAVSK